ncbi:MAG: 2-amino-4-hydroxy-6-hydroxymethyldihydropteridine diphosphokinase [Mariprofundaceae bacterium]
MNSNTMNQTDRALIAFGGNLGDVHKTFTQARDELNAVDGIEILESSMLYRTPAVGPAGQADYLNAVVSIKTSLSPDSLLKELQQIENRHGRVRKERWGARTLDLDIISYDGLHMESGLLTIPHTMMHERMFVLCPLCDIDPNWQHPLLKVTAEQLMNQLIAKGEPPLPEGEVWA